MSKFENPIQFDLKMAEGELEIVYSNLMEICQGGPEVGELSINGQKIKDKYGGPIILHGKYIYVPAYMRKLLGTGFKIARIHTNTLEIEYFGKTRSLIFLDKVDENAVYFYEDLNRTILKSQKI